jgi:hypothetical protein
VRGNCRRGDPPPLFAPAGEELDVCQPLEIELEPLVERKLSYLRCPVRFRQRFVITAQLLDCGTILPPRTLPARREPE